MSSHEKLKEIERKIKDLNMELNDLRKQRDILSEERQEIIRNRAKIELELKDLEGQINNESEEKKSLTNKMNELKKKMKETQTKIDEITPKLNQKVKDEQSVETALTTKDRRLKELYSKAGRHLKFKTKKERDDWIKNEVKEKKSLKESDEKQAEKLKNEMNKLEKEIQNLGEKISEKTKSVEEKKALISNQNSKFNEKKEERDKLTNDRKSYWKDDNEISKKVQKTQEELDRNKKKLDSTASTVITKGIQEMWRVVREQGLNSQRTQVYGTVIELFDVDSTYAQAVEVTAGNALFNVVVESSEVASRIINIINQQKSPGRITFMPLNRLNDREIDYPQTDSFIPLIKKIKFDPKFKPVFQQIFGKTMIANNLESAGQFAKQNGLNCVTLSGDQVNSKGALTGGFQDFRNSRLDTMKNIKKLQDEFNKDQKDQKKIKKSLSDIDGRVNICIGELHKLEEELNKLQNTTTQETTDLRMMIQREKSLKEVLNQQKKSFASLELSIKNSSDTIESLQKELQTDLNEQLTNSERKEVQTLNEEITKLKKDQVQIATEKSEFETTRNELQNQLNSFLTPKFEELKEQIDIMDITDHHSIIERKRIEQKQIQQEVDEITNKQKSLDDNIEKITQFIKTESEELDKLKSEDITQIKKLQEKTTQLEKLLNKRNIWIQKKEECIKQIRDLGTLPSEHEKYTDLTIKELMEKLHKANDKLKKFAHVNKKALDQYEQFSQQREEFLQKKEELDSGADAITNLIDVLDKRKDETILRTFKQVKKSFAEIFTELIPGGKASLIMNTSSNEETDSVKNSTGISILVQFSGEGEPQNMQQLSGGQKSLVALTLIFAIQRCDPAPFYLFDEIDAALDSAHRLSVAKMIKKQSETTQFIIASFKKEILDIADQYYGISFKNKVSQIKLCKKEDSLKILEEEEKEREEEEEETQQETQEKLEEKMEEIEE